MRKHIKRKKKKMLKRYIIVQMEYSINLVLKAIFSSFSHPDQYFEI